MKKYLIAVLLMFVVDNANATNAWYFGNVTSINTRGSDGSFEVYLDNESVKSFCLHDRVYFYANEMGVERTKAALSMALTAFTAGKEWGVVIDLPVTEQVCKASPSASQGAGIRD